MKPDPELALYYEHVKSGMFYVLGSLNTATCIVCCIVMILFLRLVKRIVSRTTVHTSDSRENILTSEVGVNTIVTSLHITLIIAFTILTFCEELIYPKIQLRAQIRVSTAFYFITGAVDIFVSYIIWFMLDEGQSSPLMIIDESS